MESVFLALFAAEATLSFHIENPFFDFFLQDIIKSRCIVASRDVNDRFKIPVSKDSWTTSLYRSESRFPAHFVDSRFLLLEDFLAGIRHLESEAQIQMGMARSLFFCFYCGLTSR